MEPKRRGWSRAAQQNSGWWKQWVCAALAFIPLLCRSISSYRLSQDSKESFPRSVRRLERDPIRNCHFCSKYSKFRIHAFRLIVFLLLLHHRGRGSNLVREYGECRPVGDKDAGASSPEGEKGLCSTFFFFFFLFYRQSCFPPWEAAVGC